MNKLFINFLLLFLFTKAFTQDKGEALFTFGVIADVQYADRQDHKTRHYQSSLGKLKVAVDTFNKEEVNFVFSLGDFINDGYQSFDTLISITAALQMPLYHVLGNHDFSVNDDKKDEVLQKLNMTNDYYSFEQENWRFIILNGNDISLIGNVEGTSNYKKAKQIYNQLKDASLPNAKPWNGTLSKQQRSWLKKELSRAEKKDQQVIVLCHFPLYPLESAKILWNSTEIAKIIEGSDNVVAFLNGHVHVSQYFLKDNVNYVSFRGMVEKEANAFAVISVFHDYLTITGYGVEVDRILK